MRDLLEFAAARRAKIDAELREIDEFLRLAEDLLRPGTRPVPLRDDRGPNVIAFPPHPRAAGRSATGDGPGA